jgi:hypothetical protein
MPGPGYTPSSSRNLEHYGLHKHIKVSKIHILIISIQSKATDMLPLCPSSRSGPSARSLLAHRSVQILDVQILDAINRFRVLMKHVVIVSTGPKYEWLRE